MKLAILVGVACALVTGCRRGELSGPPELHPGRDGCAECGMLIHDERSAGALLIEQDGRREHLLFDDVGCMLDHEHGHGGELGVVERFARDYGGGGWLDAGDAVFLLTESDTLRTPMGSGIAAYADRGGAEAAQGRHGGEVLGYGALGEARREWHGELREPSPGGP